MGIKQIRKGVVVMHIPRPRPSTMMVDVQNMTMKTLLHLKCVATVEEEALVILCFVFQLYPLSPKINMILYILTAVIKELRIQSFQTFLMIIHLRDALIPNR